MRVLHVIPSLSPIHGGPSKVLPLMERTLSAVGISVETVTTDDDGPRRHNGRELGVPLSENNVIRHYFRKQTEFYKISLPLVQWLKRVVKNYDLLHIHGLFSYVSVVAAQVSRRAGVPYIIRPAGVLNTYGMTQRRPQLKRLSFRWIEGPLLRDAAAVHLTSDLERKEAEKLGVSLRSKIIPHGFYFPSRTKDVAERKPWILFLSRLDPVKNVEGLLQAWESLAGEFADWQLIIAGDGEASYMLQLQKLGQSLGLALRIDWLGQVAEKQKESLLQDAGLFVLPSFSENFGIVVVEAMGAGVPCLVSEKVAVAQEGERVSACRVTAPQGEAIRVCLKELLQNASLRGELAINGRQFVLKEYGLTVMGKRLRHLYETILSK